MFGILSDSRPYSYIKYIEFSEKGKSDKKNINPTPLPPLRTATSTQSNWKMNSLPCIRIIWHFLFVDSMQRAFHQKQKICVNCFCVMHETKTSICSNNNSSSKLIVGGVLIIIAIFKMISPFPHRWNTGNMCSHIVCLSFLPLTIFYSILQISLMFTLYACFHNLFRRHITNEVVWAAEKWSDRECGRRGRERGGSKKQDLYQLISSAYYITHQSIVNYSWKNVFSSNLLVNIDCLWVFFSPLSALQWRYSIFEIIRKSENRKTRWGGRERRQRWSHRPTWDTDGECV